MKTYYEMKYNYKNLFKDAHKLTRKVVLKFKNLNYKAQFIISIRFIASELSKFKNEVCYKSSSSPISPISHSRTDYLLRKELRRLENGRNSKNRAIKIMDIKEKQNALFELIKKDFAEKDKKYFKFIDDLIGA
jgi:hypothetical protein